MNDIAMKRRRLRLDAGSLIFERRKRKFILEEGTNWPTKYSIEDRKES